jgi:DNA-binding NtrC family response regulator
MNEKTRILVVEDDPELREALQEFLMRKGYNVDIARDVTQALIKLWTGRYDIAVTDIVMPGLSGLKLLSLSKGILDVIDFIVITGYDSPENRQEAIRLGAKSYFVKPFDLDEVLKSIQTITSIRNPQNHS